MSLEGLYNEPAPVTAVRGIIAATPASDAAGVFVTIPSWGGDGRFGPCVFSQKSYARPPAGAACLIVFDETRVPWVVMWDGQTTAFPDVD